MNSNNFTDEQLVAFLDGEHEHTPAREIEAALEHDDDLAKRIEALTINTDKIAESFAALKPSAMPHLPPAPASNSNSGNGIRNAIAASLVALVIGYGAGISTGQSQPDWRDYVASYQALYTTNTLRSVSLTDAQKASELKRVASAIGKDIQLEQLNVSQQVEYKRSQVLGFNGKPLIQIAFLDSMAQPIALCIIRSDEGALLDLEMEAMEGMSAARWSKDGYEYILIGGQDDGLIQRMAEKFSETI